jgi:hypothetical protein
MRLRSRILVALSAAATAVFLTGCGAGDTPAPTANASAAWQAVRDGPLSPRQGALGLWTGREVLLIGGSDARPCPPGASCIPAEVPPLADGAAFDPQAGTWRRIADTPVPFEWAQGMVVGPTAYLWIPGSQGRPKAKSAFLAYRIEENRWEELPLPADDVGWFHGIVQVGDRIVAYTSSDEQGEQPDFVFDPADNSWSELPPDPLSPSFDRSMVWSGRELVLFDHELVPQPGSEKPAVTRAAALDLRTGSWRRLPDSEILASGPWVVVGGRLINPMLGGADGGANTWGRTYPFGGILDLASGEWSALPNPPDDEDDFGSGVLNGAASRYFGYGGWILDAARNTWLEIPPLEGEELVTDRTVVAAGADLLVFGGARWKEQSFEAALLDEAWIWSPANGSVRNSDSSSSAEAAVAVPDVVGLTEGEAVRALGASGLVANVRYADDAPRTGEVLRSDPEAESELPADSVVVLSIAYGPRLPMPAPEQEQLPKAFSRLVEDNPNAFVGLYRDEAGVVVVAFDPAADPAAWEERLTAAAESINYPEEGSGYRTATCPRSRASLEAIQDEITTRDWTKNNRLAFGVWVQPETCTVRVESDLLTTADIQALVERYGTAVSFDTSQGSHPVLLRSTE